MKRISRHRGPAPKVAEFHKKHRLPESIDMSRREDRELVSRAIRERWPTSDGVRRAAMKELEEIILDAKADRELKLDAIDRLLKAEKQNQDDELTRLRIKAERKKNDPPPANVNVQVAVVNRLEELVQHVRSDQTIVDALYGEAAPAAENQPGDACDGVVARKVEGGLASSPLGRKARRSRNGSNGKSHPAG